MLCVSTGTSGLYVPNVARYQLRHTPSDLRLQKYTFFEIKNHSEKNVCIFAVCVFSQNEM